MFMFVVYCQKEVGKKTVCKTLVKLTTGVNFTNILQAVFAPIFFRQKITNCN